MVSNHGLLLVTAPVHFLPDLKMEMQEEFDCTFAYGADKEETQILLKDNEFDAWVVSPCPTYFIDQTMFYLCPSLRMVATPSTGSNHLDVNYLKEKGIEFSCLKEAEIIDQIHASSEFTFNLMISTIRKTPFAFEAVKNGHWRNVEDQFRGRELNGLTLGIIGYGRIGSNLSRYALAFGMNVITYDPYVNIKETDVNQTDTVNDLLNEANVVVVCVHLDENTNEMVNGDMFKEMKDGVYFINTSRGDVVDETDLLNFLKNGKIEAAGLDVISDELKGDFNNHPLIDYAKKHDNLIITPHMAGLTYDSERKAQTASFHAIKDYLKPKSKD